MTAAALGAVVVVLAALLVLELAVYAPRVDRAIDATSSVRRSHEAMLDQQAGLRGFLLSGDERFLEAYHRGEGALPELNAEATDLIGGDAALGNDLFELRLAQQRWIDRWALVALDRRAGAGDVSDAFIDLDKELFDAYRDRYEVLSGKIIAQRTRAVQSQQRVLVGAVLAALAVTVAAGVMGQRRTRRLRAAAGAPLDALVRRVDQIGRGDLAPRPVQPGPEEFTRLAAGLEETAAELARSRRDAEERTRQLADQGRRQTEVLTFAREIAGNLSLRYVLRGVCGHASAVADGARVIVWLLDESRTSLEAHADSEGPDLRPLGLDPVVVGQGAVGRAGQYGRAEADDAVLAVPMVVGAQVIGVLELCGSSVAGLSTDTVAVLETMAIHAASAIEGARLHQQTSEMAMTDALTGLANRRRFDEDLRVECATSARHDRPISVLMVDVDHFKSYNDTFGHQAGDGALQAVGRLLGGSLRAGDSAYRYGGEEFTLILREAPPEDAGATAERLRAAIEHHFSGPDEPRTVTISVGVASAGATASPETLVAAADAALYEAKQSGRNRVALAG
jgi:diguanylate cyclase (GGDEF)-like protein